ncbi:MAG: hypothetical protein V4690_03020 [Patescibacteria group bacterium]
MPRVDFGLSQHPHTEKEPHGFFFIDGEQTPVCIKSVLAAQHAAVFFVLLSQIGFFDSPPLDPEDFDRLEGQVVLLGIPQSLGDDSESENIKAQFHDWDEAVRLARRELNMNRLQIVIVQGRPTFVYGEIGR